MEAVRQKYKNKQLITVFEPHTYSRVKKFYKEISKELNKSDYSYIMDIYKSREKQEDYKKITSELIIKRLEKGEKFDMKNLTKHKNSVILFMSPNDIRNIEKEYIKLYKQKFDKN